MHKYFILLFKYHHIIDQQTVLIIDRIFLYFVTIQIDRLQQRSVMLPYLFLVLKLIMDLTEELYFLRDQYKVEILMLLVNGLSIVTELQLNMI